MAVNGIEIKVGQVWRNRRGDEVTIADHDPEDGLWPWGTSIGSWHREDGTHSTAPAQGDLMELISGAPSIPTGEATELKEAVDRAAFQGATVIGEGTLHMAAPPADGALDIITIQSALLDAEHPYHLLAVALTKAFNQAATGKGKERHASDGVRFELQPMSTINRALGTVDGFVYQAHKKSLEAKRLPDGRAQAEMFGAINYLAGAIIALDTWAKKGDA